MIANQTKNAEALTKAHRALLDDLAKLETAAHLTSNDQPTELRERLLAAQRHIAEHFRFEEQNGYLDAVLKREPRLDRVIQYLREEHRSLAHTLDTIIRTVESFSHADASLREQIREWIKRVHRHEERENDLVQDAFNQDTAAED